MYATADAWIKTFLFGALGHKIGKSVNCQKVVIQTIMLVLIKGLT